MDGHTVQSTAYANLYNKHNNTLNYPNHEHTLRVSVEAQDTDDHSLHAEDEMDEHELWAMNAPSPPSKA